MLVAGRYEVLEKLGNGAFSTVYAARDAVDGKSVAVKVDSSNIRSGTRSKPLSQYEADVLEALHQRGPVLGVPRVHWRGYIDAGRSGRLPAIVMDRLGTDLESVLKRKRALRPPEAAHLAVALLGIVERIHRRGFLHRDIKPANIMIGHSDDEGVYIADFGLAKKFLGPDGKHIPRCTDKAGLTGTLRYCSVYAHFGVESSRRDDVQSVLFVLVHTLTGGLPWQSDRLRETFASEKDRVARVGAMKRDMLVSGALGAGCPPEVRDACTAVARLQFYDVPDYAGLRATLSRMAA